MESTPLWDKLRNKHCTECVLHETANTICLIGAGKIKPEVMLVGEAPGDREDKVRKPFAGRAGKLLDRILTEFGLDREGVYITNAVHCRPPGNRTPKWQEVQACRHYLIEEILLVQPKIIIALGAVACQGLLGVKKFAVGENRGNVLYIPESTGVEQIPIFPTYHPAAILRKDSYLPLVLDDFERAIKLLKGEVDEPKQDAKYFKGVADVVDNSITVDLETTGFDMYDPGGSILCAGTSVVHHEAFVTDTPSSLLSVMQDSSITKIGHNLKFDIKWLERQGIRVKGPLYDTLAAFFLLDENLPSKGLKELALQYTDMGDYDAKKVAHMKRCGNNMALVPKVVREKYCAMDADATRRLYEYSKPRLEEQGLMPLMKLMMRAYKVITEAELWGFNIDEVKRLELRSTYIQEIDQLCEWLEDLSGLENFNPNSPIQLAELLFSKLGFPIIKQTPTGKLSTDEETLLQLNDLDKTGVIKKILRLRELNGDYSKYLTPDKELTKGDGRVHCNFRITGTVTGRWSCKDPNLQQVPRQSRIKELFIPSRPQGSIMQVDYSQGELRLLAEYSRDKKLLQIFDEGKYDIHLAVAAQMVGKRPEEVTKEERKGAKTVNFGILYGEGPAKLAKQLGVSYGKAKKFMRDYMSQFGGVKEFIRSQHQTVLDKDEVVSLFGRKRRLLVLERDEEGNACEYKGFQALRQSVNAPIQGALHDLTILSMVAMRKEMRRQGMRSKFVADVHDANLIDVYDSDEERELKKMANEIYSNPDTSAFGFEFRVPLEVGIGVGKNWKEASDSG